MRGIDMERVSPSVAAKAIKKALRDSEDVRCVMAAALRRKGDSIADQAVSSLNIVLLGEERMLPRLTEELDRANQYFDIAAALEG